MAKISEFNGDYNTRLTIANEYTGQQKYVYLDSNNQIVGDQNASETFANIMRELHSSLLVGGTVVNYTVELAHAGQSFNRNRIVHEYTTIQNTPSSNKREKAKDVILLSVLYLQFLSFC